MDIKGINQENGIISAHIAKIAKESQIKALSGKSSDLKEAIENEEIILILSRIRKENYQKKLELMAELEVKFDIPYETPWDRG